MKPSSSIVRRTAAVATIAVVAAIVLGMYAQVLVNRRRARLHDAARHARREAEERKNLDVAERIGRGELETSNRASTRKIEEAARLRIPYHVARKQACLRAAARPWESLSPDPGEPGEHLIWEAMTAFDDDFFRLPSGPAWPPDVSSESFWLPNAL